jgi:hypothetical protein
MQSYTTTDTKWATAAATTGAIITAAYATIISIY